MQIKYTGFRDRPHEERQARFQNACRDGRSEIVSRRGRGAGTEARAGHLLRGGRRGPGRFRTAPRTPRLPELSGRRLTSYSGFKMRNQTLAGRVLAGTRFSVALCGPVVFPRRDSANSLPRVELTPEPN